MNTSVSASRQSTSLLNPLEFLGETRRRREELYNSLRSESILFQNNISPPSNAELGEKETEELSTRLEQFDEKLNNLESRVRKLELHQNIIYNVENEAIHRLKRELHQVKLQYLQSLTQSEEIITKLYQENQELRSRILLLTAETERRRSSLVSAMNVSSSLQSQFQPQSQPQLQQSQQQNFSFEQSSKPSESMSLNPSVVITKPPLQQPPQQQPQLGPRNLIRTEVDYPQGYDPMKRRFSVSSECFNPEDILNSQPKIIPKSEELKTAIRNAVRHNVLFKHLNAEQLEEIVNAMWEVNYNAGDIVIKQNDDGDNMYIVSKGELDVLYSGEVVATIGPGKAFGEIALMYNCPRTATVRAITPVTLWAMDRATFRRILMQESIRRRALYESFLAKVPIFESLLPYERAKVADALDTVTFNDGDVIIRQGDTEGDKFYIIEKGEVVCEKSSSDTSGPPVESMRLGPGSYFGELALLTNQPRQATVRAVGPVKCLTISREHFVQVMGPCEDILKRNMKNYATYEELIKRSTLQNLTNRTNISQEKTTTEVEIKEKLDRPALCKRIFDSEKEYVDKLNCLVKGYRNRIIQKPELNISSEEINKIFSNSELILNVHEIFLKELDEKLHTLPDPSLGELFFNLAKTLNVYKTYVQNYYSSLVLLSKRKQSPSFMKFLKDVKTSPDIHEEDLDKLLELPFTRISVYTRLFTELLNVTDEKHPDREPLQMCVKAFLELEAVLDQVRKQAEKVYNIYISISGEHENFVDPNRVFLREDNCIGTDGQKYKSFLFNDFLLITKLIDIGGGETKYFHFKTVDLKSVQIARSDTKIRLIWTNRHQKEEHLDFALQDNTKPWIDAILEVINNNLNVSHVHADK